MYDEAEEDRTEHVAMLKARGKGAPKKAKSAAGEYILCSVVQEGHRVLSTSRLTFLVSQKATRRGRSGRSSSWARDVYDLLHSSSICIERRSAQWADTIVRYAGILSSYLCRIAPMEMTSPSSQPSKGDLAL